MKAALLFCLVYSVVNDTSEELLFPKVLFKFELNTKPQYFRNLKKMNIPSPTYAIILWALANALTHS